MSKMDALRAMREARYAQAATPRAPSVPSTPSAQAAGAPAAPKRTPKAAAPKGRSATPAAAPDGEACGHRNMSGRSCTRPQGHTEKSHRYS